MSKSKYLQFKHISVGLDSNNRFPWGNEFYKDGKKHRMNTWQSTIHDKFLQDKNVFKHSFLPTHDGHAFYSANNSGEVARIEKSTINYFCGYSRRWF